MQKIIAAVRSEEELSYAICSGAEIVFMLSSNIEDLKGQTERTHEAGKKLFIHLDLAEGIGKDEYGIRFVRSLGIDGIISTRANIIKLAKKHGLFTVQRFFIVDSHSVETTVESAKKSGADMIEIMPGTVCKVIRRLKNELDMPIVAGGLIETGEEISEAFEAGVSAVSSSRREMW